METCSSQSVFPKIDENSNTLDSSDFKLVANRSPEVVANDPTMKMVLHNATYSLRMPDPDSVWYMEDTVPKLTTTRFWCWSKSWLLHLFDAMWWPIVDAQRGKLFFPYDVPHAKSADRMKGNDSRGLRKLTKKQEKHNEDLRSVRARVKLPYGLLKNKWKSLNSSFRDGEETQSDLVLLAAALHNASLWCHRVEFVNDLIL